MTRPLRIALCAGSIGLVGFAMSQGFPLCPMAGSFGIPCPGCGLTRATLALLRGDIPTALRFHPLVAVLTPLFILFVGSALWQLLRDPRAPRRSLCIRWNAPLLNVGATLLLILTLGVWLARFAGYFGGPVQVTTLHAWVHEHVR